MVAFWLEFSVKSKDRVRIRKLSISHKGIELCHLDAHGTWATVLIMALILVTVWLVYS